MNKKIKRETETQRDGKTDRQKGSEKKIKRPRDREIQTERLRGW